MGKKRTTRWLLVIHCPKNKLCRSVPYSARLLMSGHKTLERFLGKKQTMN